MIAQLNFKAMKVALWHNFSYQFNINLATASYLESRDAIASNPETRDAIASKSIQAHLTVSSKLIVYLGFCTEI